MGSPTARSAPGIIAGTLRRRSQGRGAGLCDVRGVPGGVVSAPASRPALLPRRPAHRGRAVADRRGGGGVHGGHRGGRIRSCVSHPGEQFPARCAAHVRGAVSGFRLPACRSLGCSAWSRGRCCTGGTRAPALASDSVTARDWRVRPPRWPSEAGAPRPLQGHGSAPRRSRARDAGSGRRRSARGATARKRGSRSPASG